jgi:hypothetical protein
VRQCAIYHPPRAIVFSSCFAQNFEESHWTIAKAIYLLKIIAILLARNFGRVIAIT